LFKKTAFMQKHKSCFFVFLTAKKFFNIGLKPDSIDLVQIG